MTARSDSPTPRAAHVGRSIAHEAATEHVTGGALYTDDLTTRFVGALHAWPVVSPHAQARVVTVDATSALARPGVVTVLTADDVPGEGNTGPAQKDELLFPSEAGFVGHAVAWVLADDEQTARAASLEVEVDYEVLDALPSLEAAIEAGAMLTEDVAIERGDVEAALTAAPHRLSGQLTIGGQEHFYLETHASLAYLDETGHVVVHASTQHPTETQIIVARVLGLPAADVTCQSLRMGGAFGGKETQANTWAAVAAVGAVKTGRPVRVRLDRLRDFTSTGKRHPFLAKWEVGFQDDGKLDGVRIDLTGDGGYSLDLSRPILWRALFHVDGSYQVPALTVVGRVARTNRPSNTAFRGFGGPQGMLVIEEILDHVARHLALAPHQVRRRNFYREGDRTHYGQLVKDAGRIEQIWGDLLERSDFGARLGEVTSYNATSPHAKRGIAVTPVKFGISFTTAFFNQAGALALIYADGSVQLNHGGTEMGQGLHTKMLQIAADGLGVSVESIRMMPTRTDKVPNTSATAASSGSDLNGAAVADACQKLQARLTPIAAELLGVPGSSVVFAHDEVYPEGREADAVPFARVAKEAYLARVPLFATGYYKTPNIHFDEAEGRGKPFHYFAYGAAVSEVEVDGFTGQLTLRRVDILHDVGASLSPLLDRGQLEGGFAQGMGWLTREELVWADDGRLLTAGASTYKLPGLDDCPPVFNVTLMPKAADPDVIHGSKAVGEPPFMLAISVREAIRAAVAAFGAKDTKTVELMCPATPEAIYWAIEAVREPEHPGMATPHD